MSAPDDFSEWAKGFAPEVLAYLERRRIDRREVFEMAFAVAEGEAKVDLAIAYLQSNVELPQEAIQAAMRKAGMPS